MLPPRLVSSPTETCIMQKIMVGEDTDHGNKRHLPPRLVSSPTETCVMKKIMVGEDTDHGNKRHLPSVGVLTNRNLCCEEAYGG